MVQCTLHRSIDIPSVSTRYQRFGCSVLWLDGCFHRIIYFDAKLLPSDFFIIHYLHEESGQMLVSGGESCQHEAMVYLLSIVSIYVNIYSILHKMQNRRVHRFFVCSRCVFLFAQNTILSLRRTVTDAQHPRHLAQRV